MTIQLESRGITLLNVAAVSAALLLALHAHAQPAQNAGFVLEESSEINANPNDTADHPLGVWMLPPTLDRPQPGTPEAEGYDPAKYAAIGESDRMTLRFRKPEAAATAEPAPPAQ